MLGRGLVDVCLVYGLPPSVLVQAPGGRDNAKVVPKVYFELLSVRHPDGQYYLRPDRIQCSMLIDAHQALPAPSPEETSRLEAECRRDQEVKQHLAEGEVEALAHAVRITQNFSAPQQSDMDAQEDVESVPPPRRRGSAFLRHLVARSSSPRVSASSGRGALLQSPSGGGSWDEETPTEPSAVPASTRFQTMERQGSHWGLELPFRGVNPSASSSTGDEATPHGPGSIENPVYRHAVRHTP